MHDPTHTYSLPRWRWTRWMTYAGPKVPREIRVALVGSLYTTLPIFIGGIVNTIAVAALIAFRIPTLPILLWFGLEVVICLTRLAVLLVARRAAREGRPTPTDLNILLSLAWSASIGYGTFISLVCGDWVVASLACFSAAGMAGGSCFRNFAAPRLAAFMVALSLGPAAIGAAFAHQPILFAMLIQVPIYVAFMTNAAFRLNTMMIATMRSNRANDIRARHDTLTGLSNRAGLAQAMQTMRGLRDRRLGLLYLDLDGFKAVNDTHGHAVGDRLLRMVADRMRGVIGKDAVAARVGGDEFVVLCCDRDRTALVSLAEQLLARLSEPYAYGSDTSMNVGVSIGIAIRPDNGDGLTELLSAADGALYRAKTSGKARYAFAGHALDKYILPNSLSA